MLAQKIKLLAHHNKLRACRLLNPPDACSPPVFGLFDLSCGIFSDFRIGMHWRHMRAPKCTRKLRRIQGTILSTISHKSLGELRIARACVRLLGIPDGGPEKSVSLARIGSCEIRIFEGPQVTSDGMRSFWLELFDHGANKSVDSCSFHEIEDAVVVFEDFISQADRLKAASGPDDAGTPD
jgi:hypothetical protein